MLKHLTASLVVATSFACAADPDRQAASADIAGGGAPVPTDGTASGAAPASPHAPPGAPGGTPAAPGVDVGAAGGMTPGDNPPGAAAGGDGAAGASVDPTAATGMHVEHPAGESVRFIAVGDTGTGDANQILVAERMAQKCAAEGCDFVILLGDNIYDKGPATLDDPQWQLKFETPYAMLDIPFYVVLGNHDVAVEPLFGSGHAPGQGALEVMYSERSDKWNMPATHYTLSAGPVAFLMLDTTALYNHVTTEGDQHAWVGPARDALLGAHSWVFSAGHHTYVSNGDHGNAGAYAYFDFDPGLEIKQFFDTNLCGFIDIVLTGHDHNRQWLDGSACHGTEVIVSGAGAKVRELPGSNPVHWESDQLGFLYVVADAERLTGQFIGSDGSVDFERTLTKDATGPTGP